MRCILISKRATVTIIMATCDGEKFVTKQIESILRQSYQDYELIIADDNSTDATQSILKYYAKTHKNISFFVNSERLGVVKNFEKLMTLAEGKYIAFCDQDDIWEKEKLQVEMDAILKAQVDGSACLVHSDLSMIDDADRLLHPSYFKYRGYILNDQKDLGHILGPCGVMGNTLLINQKLKDLVLPFPEQLDVHDYWIAVVCELHGKRVTLHQQLVNYRIHETNSSNRRSTLIKQKNRSLCEVNLPNLRTNRRFFLPGLLKNIENREDQKILNAYLEYLQFKKDKIYLYFNLIRYKLIKRSIVFRVKILFKVLCKKREV